MNEKKIVKKLGKLFALFANANSFNPPKEAPNKKEAQSTAPMAGKFSAAVSKGIMETTGPMLPKWMQKVSKTEEDQRKFREKIDKEKNAGKKAAMEKIAELNDYSIKLFREWAGAIGNEKEDLKNAADYAKRLLDEQTYRTSSANIKTLVERKEPAASDIKGDVDLLPLGIDKNKLNSVLAKGYEFKAIRDHNCKEFIAAYAVMRGYFGADELDPSRDLMTMIDAGPTLGNAYMRYFLTVAKDKDGKVVGAHDGNYFGSRESSALYGAHIAVIADEQKMGVATLLHEAALKEGNSYAIDAETAWKEERGVALDYGKMIKSQTATGGRLIKGNKLMYVIGEVEPPNLASMEDAQATIERNAIHARMFNFAVIPMVDYKQVDLNWSADKPYVEVDGKPPADWNTVPLLLYVRVVGNESATSIFVGEAKQISKIMTDIFAEAGMYSAKGVEADYQHSVERMAKMRDTDRIPIIELPREGTKVEILEKFFKIIPQIGTMEERCTNFYANYLWAHEYLEALRRAQKKGETVTLEQAHEHIISEAKKSAEFPVHRD